MIDDYDQDLMGSRNVKPQKEKYYWEKSYEEIPLVYKDNI
jgi:hypothetical protein